MQLRVGVRVLLLELLHDGARLRRRLHVWIMNRSSPEFHRRYILAVHTVPQKAGEPGPADRPHTVETPAPDWRGCRAASSSPRDIDVRTCTPRFGARGIRPTAPQSVEHQCRG